MRVTVLTGLFPFDKVIAGVCGTKEAPFTWNEESMWVLLDYSQ